MNINNKLSLSLLCIMLSCTGCGLSSANRNYAKAIDAYDQGNYTDASGYFLNAIQDNDEKAEYHIDYGFNLIQLKDYKTAIEQFQSIIMDSDIKMVKENNKKAYRGMGIAYLALNEFSDAIICFEQALSMPELDELNNDLLYYKANAIEKSGDYSKAIEIYTQILENNSKDEAILSARANTYRVLGEYEKCLTDYNQAISMNPKNFDLYFGKFAALKELGRDTEAVAALKEASLITCKTKEEQFELAKVHFYQGEYEYAVNELNTSTEEGYTEGYFFLGEIYLAQGDYDSAIAMYTSLIDAGNTVSAMLYNQLLTCYINIDDYEMAESCLKKARLLSDVSIQDQLLKNEIIYLERTGQFEEALTKMETYLEKYPEDVQAQKDHYFLTTRVEGTRQNASSGTLGQIIVDKP